ncbi:MAG: lysophospholipid acyltransferase family protein [Clostridia bacterium]|nr:lysophospholipid acyltransferase family protein [Deltaproteobacteria bacterium]
MLVRFLSFIVCRLPLEKALAFARAIAWVWFWVVPVRKGVAMVNVRKALGDDAPAGRIVQGCMKTLTMFVVESLRLPRLTRAKADEIVEVRGQEILDAALAQGRGVVVITAHMGNFDLLGCVHALRGIKANIVYKNIGWRSAHAFFFAARRKAGVTVIAPKGSERQILRALRSNEAVGFVIDQHMPKHRGIVCTFFGRYVSTTPAPALFALKTGALVVPALIRRVGDSGHHVSQIYPPIVMEQPHADRAANLRHNTQRMNDWLEAEVRKTPEQWLWLHKRWKVDDNPHGWDL